MIFRGSGSRNCPCAHRRSNGRGNAPQTACRPARRCTGSRTRRWNHVAEGPFASWQQFSAAGAVGQPAAARRTGSCCSGWRRPRSKAAGAWKSRRCSGKSARRSRPLARTRWHGTMITKGFWPIARATELRGARRPEAGGDFAIAAGFAERNRARELVHTLVEGMNAGHVEGDVGEVGRRCRAARLQSRRSRCRHSAAAAVRGHRDIGAASGRGFRSRGPREAARPRPRAGPMRCRTGLKPYRKCVYPRPAITPPTPDGMVTPSEASASGKFGMG